MKSEFQKFWEDKFATDKIAKQAEGEGHWITLPDGRHIFIGEGKAPKGTPKVVHQTMASAINNEAINAVNAGRDVPKTVEDDEFSLKWVKTDPVRGYYEAVPKKGSGWQKIHDGWVTGDWEDAPESARGSVHESNMGNFLRDVNKLGGELKVIYTPTSNVFSTGFDAFVRGIPADKANELADKHFKDR
jgi:hypothetical protein